MSDSRVFLRSTVCDLLTASGFSLTTLWLILQMVLHRPMSMERQHFRKSEP
jgi:hypothetical protein